MLSRMIIHFVQLGISRDVSSEIESANISWKLTSWDKEENGRVLNKRGESRKSHVSGWKRARRRWRGWMELSSMADRWSTEEHHPRLNFRGRDENLRAVRSNLKQWPAFASKEFSKNFCWIVRRVVTVNFGEKGELGIAVRELRSEDEGETASATGTRELTNENSSWNSARLWYSVWVLP